MNIRNGTDTTEGAQIRKILDHIGVDSQSPRISPARGSSLWGDCDGPVGGGVEIEPDLGLAAQPVPDYEVDQRVNWWQDKPATQTRCGVNLCLAYAAHRKSLFCTPLFSDDSFNQSIAAGKAGFSL